jgi:DNA polymerase-3 subunit alpha (Gram-positive type)
MIIFDTETTGLVEPASVPLDRQPEIIEFAAVRLDINTLEEQSYISFLVKPKRLPLPEKIVGITGITDDMLKDARSFARHLPTIEMFFLGVPICVAHNCKFDIDMLRLELMRLDRVCKFPWPPQQLCTVEENMDITGRRMRLIDLYEHAIGAKPTTSHRALDDVRTLAEVVRWMRRNNKI